jgi:hypothetical protein
VTSPRFKVEPRDVPPAVAARLLGLTEERFLSCLPDLMARGFPAPDDTTGNYDLKAVNAWQDRRSGFGVAAAQAAKDAQTVVASRLGGLGRG